MVDDLQWGVLDEPPLEVTEALAMGPPLEVVVGLPLEETARVEQELGLGEGQWVIALWDQHLGANFGRDL